MDEKIVELLPDMWGRTTDIARVELYPTGSTVFDKSGALLYENTKLPFLRVFRYGMEDSFVEYDSLYDAREDARKLVDMINGV